ncbi:CU044_5270 family protein [Streptosporangium sp. NPDC051022]|uniref:CU044_5270 family protein n=1 Tax=Streptosporangium sp. NPDC051022 TaxID=3155752 RepID=UPI00341B6EF5
MDELSTLRELYGEPRPDPLLETRVRERLNAESRRGRRRLPWTTAMAGLVAAATAAAAVAIAVPATTVFTTATPTTTAPTTAIPTTTGRTGETGEGGGTRVPGPATTVSGQSILLAAAATAESGGAATGAYWHVRKLNRRTYPERLGSGGDRYWVVESRLTEQWVSGDGRVWSGSRALGTRPRSGADEAAWRRDGSPTRWPVREGVLSASPGEGSLKAVTGGAAFSMAGREMTFEQIRRLPADPAALLRRVAETVRDAPAGPSDGVVADALSGLLWSKPSPPDVRAAAYRALAELPNVRYLGEATDERGRTGAAFSFAPQAAMGVRRTLIIDPRSSQVLSSTVTGQPGTVGDQVELVLEAGWTDERPAVPALP